VDEQINGGLVAAKIISRLPRARRERILEAIAVTAPRVFSKIELNLMELEALSKQSASTLLNQANQQEIAEITGTTLFANISEKRKATIQAELRRIELATPAELQHSKEKIIELIEELNQEKSPARIVV
jgi:hypothetical protein